MGILVVPKGNISITWLTLRLKQNGEKKRRKKKAYTSFFKDIYTYILNVFHDLMEYTATQPKEEKGKMQEHMYLNIGIAVR